MRLVPKAKSPALKSEQIILFRVGGLLFAISSASVQEVRSVDSLAGASAELNHSGLHKVRHVLQRGERTLFVVNGTLHFGLPAKPGTLVFILRQTRTALLVDGIEKMTTITRLQSLPLAFYAEERQWYRGLAALDQSVIPVVNPDGFLNPRELAQLDESFALKIATEESAPPAGELP